MMVVGVLWMYGWMVYGVLFTQLLSFGCWMCGWFDVFFSTPFCCFPDTQLFSFFLCVLTIMAFRRGFFCRSYFMFDSWGVMDV